LVRFEINIAPIDREEERHNDVDTEFNEKSLLCGHGDIKIRILLDSNLMFSIFHELEDNAKKHYCAADNVWAEFTWYTLRSSFQLVNVLG